MNLTTDITVYSNCDESQLNNVAERLLTTIKEFAQMSYNRAFWTEGVREKSTHCIIVRGGFDGVLDNASYIKNARLEDALREWCREVADCCKASPDEDKDDERYAHMTLRVEMWDKEFDGGLSVVCYNNDDTEEFSVYILPIKEDLVVERTDLMAILSENGESAAGAVRKQKPRNGEVKVDHDHVDCESVARGATRSNTGDTPAAARGDIAAGQ